MWCSQASLGIGHPATAFWRRGQSAASLTAALAIMRWMLAGALLLVIAVGTTGPATAESGSVKRGSYLFAIAGCASCHTDFINKGPLLAGGPALRTPFGVFYGPNITPDRTHGIGAWSDADFIRALREGVRPDGAHLFPTFPYTSFTLITEGDLLDIKAYIFSLPPVARPSREHDISFPFSWRWLQTFWRWLNFTPGPFKPNPTKDGAWNRGAYIVQALAHCGECHTPRDMTGGLKTAVAFSGTANGPEGQKVPNITRDAETGIGRWSHRQLVAFLRTGFLPNGDVAGSLMAEVIGRGTRKMTDADRDAVATYLESLPAIPNPAARAIQPGSD
jgi:mono/diheme cytochrome c family protein